MRVLVVDDDPIGLNARRMVLEHVGHQVVVASTVEEAQAGIETQPDAVLPDVVLMDLRLPKSEDGLRLLRMLHEAAPGIRIVVLSGYPSDLDGAAERAYASEILAKPAPTEAVLKALAAEA